MTKKVVIIGGGFAGLNAAQGLNQKDIELLLIDRTNHHLFQPLLYQVASSALSPGDIATPIRAILKKQDFTKVILGDVKTISKEKKEITLADGKVFSFDYLIVATGARHHYFGHTSWEKFAPGLKTARDALKIRERILMSFENAEKETNEASLKRMLTFVIVGAGPTGVEMAGAIQEIASKTMLENFRQIDPSKARVILIEGSKRVLPTFSEKSSAAAQRMLEKLGVEVKLETMVKKISAKKVLAGEESIDTENIIWAAGNRTGAVLKSLKSEQDNIGRVKVNDDLSLPHCKNIFILGDAACVATGQGQTLPGIAPVAIQQGKYIAKLISNELKGKARTPFAYSDKGIMATIGKARAVAKVGKIEFAGLFAWLIWIFVHIMYLIGFRNRLIVLSEWLWNYVTSQRAARLILNPGRFQKKTNKR